MLLTRIRFPRWSVLPALLLVLAATSPALPADAQAADTESGSVVIDTQRDAPVEPKGRVTGPGETRRCSFVLPCQMDHNSTSDVTDQGGPALWFDYDVLA